MNLLTNAMDSYQHIRRKDKQIHIQLSVHKGSVRMEIRDWGGGIEKKYLNKIFDPLFTTKGKERGTGLGLTICKEVIEKDFGGTCRVESKAMSGTTFYIEFPLRRS
jgi:two-component system sensor histidine kinase DctS